MGHPIIIKYCKISTVLLTLTICKGEPEDWGSVLSLPWCDIRTSILESLSLRACNQGPEATTGIKLPASLTFWTSLQMMYSRGTWPRMFGLEPASLKTNPSSAKDTEMLAGSDWKPEKFFQQSVTCCLPLLKYCSPFLLCPVSWPLARTCSCQFCSCDRACWIAWQRNCHCMEPTDLPHSTSVQSQRKFHLAPTSF